MSVTLPTQNPPTTIHDIMPNNDKSDANMLRRDANDMDTANRHHDSATIR